MTRVAAAVLSAIVLAAPARADVRLVVSGAATSAVALSLQVANRGDQAATAVTPEIAYQRQEVIGDPDPIEPGGVREWNLALPPSTGPGTFPAIVQVRYLEPGTGRASTPGVVLVEVPTAPPAAVDATLTAAPGPGFTSARLQLRSRAARALAGRVAFLVPSSLRTDPESEPVQLAPGETRVVPVALEGGRPGASYPVYAVVEYRDGGIHHTAVAHAEMTVDGGPGRGGRLAIGAVALAVAFGLLALAWRAAARRRTA